MKKAWMKIGKIVITTRICLAMFTGLTVLLGMSHGLTLDMTHGINKTYSVFSSKHVFLVELSPASQKGSDGIGTIFSLERNIKQKEEWNFLWYSRKVELSDDGVHLVRWWNIDSIDRTHFMDTLIGFYQKDSLLASYAIADLVKDPGRIKIYGNNNFEVTSAHSSFQQGLLAEKNQFSLVTIDKLHYVFDLSTGKILSVAPDTSARGIFDRDKLFPDVKSRKAK